MRRRAKEEKTALEAELARAAAEAEAGRDAARRELRETKAKAHKREKALELELRETAARGNRNAALAELLVKEKDRVADELMRLRKARLRAPARARNLPSPRRRGNSRGVSRESTSVVASSFTPSPASPRAARL